MKEYLHFQVFVDIVKKVIIVLAVYYRDCSGGGAELDCVTLKAE